MPQALAEQAIPALSCELGFILRRSPEGASVLKISPKQMKVFQDLELSKFKKRVLAELDRSYALFPRLAEQQRQALVDLYVDSSLKLGFRTQKAVLNYVVSCWFAQKDLARDEATVNWLSKSELDDVRTTEKLKRIMILRHCAALHGLDPDEIHE